MATTLTLNPLTGNFDVVLVATATVQTFLATPSSANLAAAVTDETGSGALVFATSPTFTTTATVTRSALAAVSTDGVIVENATASTAGVPVQMSPRVNLKGHAWNSTGSADETESFFFENLPATTAGTITGTLKVGFMNNAGTVTYPMLVSSGAGGSTFLTSVSTTNFILAGIRILSGYGTGLLNFTDPTQTVGVGIDVATDATLKIRTRAQTADAQLSAASVRGNAVAFASVPATPVEGMLVAVTDSSTNVWGATITGGGANHVLAFYNGTNWTVAGK